MVGLLSVDEEEGKKRRENWYKHTGTWTHTHEGEIEGKCVRMIGVSDMREGAWNEGANEDKWPQKNKIESDRERERQDSEW